APPEAWAAAAALWRGILDPSPAIEPSTDRRFRAAGWRSPAFDLIRRGYEMLSTQLTEGVEALPGLDERQRAQLRFATRGFVEAMSPSNFPLTNPEVIERTIETRGESLRAGLDHLMADIAKGQLTHADPAAFELGRTIATTPGKVVARTRLYELIHYAPTTDAVLATPLVIFPPWINRFYILDLTPEKSFIRWCVEQGISVFMVSWRSADASLKDVIWDDYVAAQVEAVDTVRALLDVPSVHTVGYCVAGTTLAATLALLAAREEDARIASATFFTAQVDFAAAGELQHFVGDETLAMLDRLSPDGWFDGRYMAATFNLLRGRDLIWNYVTSNYLLGEDHPSFDLLHWNGDVTNLPAAWHRSYLTDLYRDNSLVKPGALSVDGIPLDLTRVTTPAYVQAGREDHIAPAESVWRITEHFAGPLRFVLAGSGHIAGVVNPPAAGKYQHWVNDEPTARALGSLDAFIAGAREVKGSWWPDWLNWLQELDGAMVPVAGARVPGGGSLAALADAPGDYVRQR
ncbi:PHA/PHB synthase family protein, partial [Sphingomonas bacterium]|uniref:PHA/PHB synthase family protein n=1 Tax=Sphingomonas bacterium TaxID=1895847 RepID=UPI001575D669